MLNSSQEVISAAKSWVLHFIKPTGHFCNARQKQARICSVTVQIIAPEQDKYIKRTPDGTPMEVALTQDLRHPNIVQTFRHASFTSQVCLTCSVLS